VKIACRRQFPFNGSLSGIQGRLTFDIVHFRPEVIRAIRFGHAVKVLGKGPPSHNPTPAKIIESLNRCQGDGDGSEGQARSWQGTLTIPLKALCFDGNSRVNVTLPPHGLIINVPLNEPENTGIQNRHIQIKQNNLRAGG
jgi:hypothetical protein